MSLGHLTVEELLRNVSSHPNATKSPVIRAMYEALQHYVELELNSIQTGVDMKCPCCEAEVHIEFSADDEKYVISAT